MRYFSLKTLIPLSTAVLSGALLIWTAQNVQQKEHELSVLKSAILSEQENIRVLETEWDYLNQPQRLETLSQKYLDLAPIDTSNIGTDGQALPHHTAPRTPQRKPAIPASRFPSTKATFQNLPFPSSQTLSPRLTSSQTHPSGGTP